MNYLDFDRQHIWHPYTSITDPLPVHQIVGAKGVYLKTADGKLLIDGMSSWWSTVHGYNHPQINRAIKKQLKKMSHVMFGGLTHQPAIDLARKLIELTPDSLQHVFFADSGSVAVEVALKMAIQYYAPERSKILTVKRGYHGDTLGAMSVCDPVTGMHSLFKNILPQQIFAASPACKFFDHWNDHYFDEIKTIIERNYQQIAAVIIEPVVQGAGGMNFYHPQYLNLLRKICDKYQILLIFDEIATGFGRTGKLFATQFTEIQPDILCLGKALTGGYLTLSAVLTNQKVAQGVSKNNMPLMHGPTFMANPLACATALSSIQLLLKSNWQQNVDFIQEKLQQTLLPLKKYSTVADARVLGAIGVVEMKEAVNVSKIQELFIKEGVWLRPFGKLIYTMPPFIINRKQLNILTTAFEKVISHV